jgi:hypothetical protein
MKVRLSQPEMNRLFYVSCFTATAIFLAVVFFVYAPLLGWALLLISLLTLWVLTIDGPSRRTKAAATSALICCIIVVVSVAALFAYAFTQSSFLVKGRVISRTGEWATFKNTVKSYGLLIPAEAQIIEAKEKSAWPMGETVTVRFRLPQTRSSQEWVRFIAKQSSLDVKQNEFLYEANPKTSDYMKIEFLPDENIYEAVAEWD